LLVALALRPGGVATVRFGTAKAQAVAELSALFGAAAGRGVNTGCAPRYTEVVWGDLAAEFRANRFSGYRYVQGGYPLTTPGSPRAPAKSLGLATAKGVTLGATLARVRAAYKPLTRIGADAWRAPNGLVFAVGDATQRVVEIKTGTCGDF
jgi:hypothetical protein